MKVICWYKKVSLSWNKKDCFVNILNRDTLFTRIAFDWLFPNDETSKHNLSNVVHDCMCEAVRRSVGSTVYTWERLNNHSTGTRHTIGESACWEKTQPCACISGRRDNDDANVYVFDRWDSKPPRPGWQNLHDHTPHTRNDVSQWCRQSPQWLVGLL